MVDPVSILTGIALVKKSVDFIKSNIATAQDIGDIISHVDNALNGQQQAIKEREKKGADPFAIDNVAQEVIDVKLAQERLYEMKMLIDTRFGHGTWSFILEERKKRIDAKKQAIKEAKAKAQKKQQEMVDMIRNIALVVGGFIFIGLCVFLVYILFTTKGLAHPVEGDEESCKLYEPKYYLICLSEGRGYADTQLYLDYQLQKDNWIIEKD
tara:strand:- start:3493 stop:4125 length:633 start_codon:yes stop_codon:yes gene_type:complete